MSIQEIIDFLVALKAEKGDIFIGCDFRDHDDKLYYNEKLGVVFGDSAE